MRSVILILVVILIMMSAIHAQNTEPAGPDPGCANENTKQLRFLDGEWKVKSRFRISGSPEVWEETDAVAVIEHVFQDCLLREKYSGLRENKAWSAIGLYSYSNLSDSFQWVGGHSRHGVLALYEGGFEDGELRLVSSAEIRGRTILFRRVLTKKETGFEVRSERSIDGGKTWDAGWYLSYYQ